MAVRELFLLFVLGFEGISGNEPKFYHKVGDKVVLPCIGTSVHSCSGVSWLYNDIEGSNTLTKVSNGNIDPKSAYAARLSLDSSCSLIIKNIIAEDAGRYTCRFQTETPLDRLMHLNILSISPSQPADERAEDENVKLQCSLWTYLEKCPENGLRWVDDTGTEPIGEHVINQNNTGKHTKCVSILTVKHQTGSNRKYTCRYYNGSKITIEDHYSMVSTDASHLNYISIIGAVVAAVVLLLLAVTVLILMRNGRGSKESEDKINKKSDVKIQHPNMDQNDEPRSSLTYATVDHFNSPHKIRVKDQEDVVTYSVLKPKMETGVDIDPSSLYSCVSTLK